MDDLSCGVRDRRREGGVVLSPCFCCGGACSGSGSVLLLACLWVDGQGGGGNSSGANQVRGGLSGFRGVRRALFSGIVGCRCSCSCCCLCLWDIDPWGSLGSG